MKKVQERMQKVVEGRLSRLQEKRKALLKDWAPYLNAVDGYMQENQNRKLTTMDKHNIAQCLENALMETGLGRSSSIMEDVSVYDERKNAYHCPICGDNTDITNIELSYAFKLMLDELKSLIIYPKLKLKGKY